MVNNAIKAGVGQAGDADKSPEGRGPREGAARTLHAEDLVTHRHQELHWVDHQEPRYDAQIE
jgi:hypothetical protein